MGGPLAALGLLSSCGSLDEDSAYYPRRQGIYAQVDTSLWWIGEEQAPVQAALPVRSLAAAERWAAALSANEPLVYLLRPGQLRPAYALALSEQGTCLAARVEKKTLILYVGTSSGLLVGEMPAEEPTAPTRWHLHSTQAPVHAIAVAPSFAVAAAGRQLLVLDAAHRRIQTLDLPGPILKLWIEHPTGAAGTWQGRDTVYSFSYLYPARQLSVETTQPSVYRARLTSPYVQRNFGIEYTGAVQLTVAGLLNPGGHAAVESFSVDFLGGEVFFLRRDSLWSYLTTTPSRTILRSIFAGARVVETLPVYSYGSTEVTTK